MSMKKNQIFFMAIMRSVSWFGRKNINFFAIAIKEFGV